MVLYSYRLHSIGKKILVAEGNASILIFTFRSLTVFFQSCYYRMNSETFNFSYLLPDRDQSPGIGSVLTPIEIAKGLDERKANLTEERFQLRQVI